MKDIKLALCTHQVPQNDLGYFAMHCRSNVQLPPKAYLAIINGPLKVMQKKIDAALANPTEIPPDGH